MVHYSYYNLVAREFKKKLELAYCNNVQCSSYKSFCCDVNAAGYLSLPTKQELLAPQVLGVSQNSMDTDTTSLSKPRPYGFTGLSMAMQHSRSRVWIKGSSIRHLADVYLVYLFIYVTRRKGICLKNLYCNTSINDIYVMHCRYRNMAIYFETVCGWFLVTYRIKLSGTACL